MELSNQQLLDQQLRIDRLQQRILASQLMSDYQDPLDSRHPACAPLGAISTDAQFAWLDALWNRVRSPTGEYYHFDDLPRSRAAVADLYEHIDSATSSVHIPRVRGDAGAISRLIQSHDPEPNDALFSMLNQLVERGVPGDIPHTADGMRQLAIRNPIVRILVDSSAFQRFLAHPYIPDVFLLVRYSGATYVMGLRMGDHVTLHTLVGHAVAKVHMENIRPGSEDAIMPTYDPATRLNQSHHCVVTQEERYGPSDPTRHLDLGIGARLSGPISVQFVIASHSQVSCVIFKSVDLERGMHTLVCDAGEGTQEPFSDRISRWKVPDGVRPTVFLRQLVERFRPDGQRISTGQLRECVEKAINSLG